MEVLEAAGKRADDVSTRRVACPGVHIPSATRSVPHWRCEVRRLERFRNAEHHDLDTTQRHMHLSPAALEAAIQLLETGGEFRGEIVETADCRRSTTH